MAIWESEQFRAACRQLADQCIRGDIIARTGMSNQEIRALIVEHAREQLAGIEQSDPMFAETIMSQFTEVLDEALANHEKSRRRK